MLLRVDIRLDKADGRKENPRLFGWLRVDIRLNKVDGRNDENRRSLGWLRKSIIMLEGRLY